MIMLQQHLQIMMPSLVLLVLATSCYRVISTSDRICHGPYDDNIGRRCSPARWVSSATQERVLQTFTYDAFKLGGGSSCVPFDIKTGTDGQTRTVYSYFSCDVYDETGDERACVSCRDEGIRSLRAWCPGSYGAVYKSDVCCLRYETYNMCN
ncbi:hypothetical protein LINGRAHAP2_LOCUS8841 [Linum grandiflorum]